MADAKVTGLDALATVADADILYVVDDVAGTATSKKITRLNLLTSAAIGGTVEATTLTDGTASITGGDLSSVGDIGCDNVTATDTLTGDTLTDGTATLTSGALSGVTNYAGGAVFNEAGADVDFRVEGDTNTNALVVDGGTDSVGLLGSPLAVAGALDWVTGNTIYVPIGGVIADYITAATAGDTLQLAAGTYTITSGLTVDKKLHIKGMGRGITTITSATDNIDMVTFTTTAGSRISDLSMSITGARTTTAKYMITGTASFNVSNVDFSDTTTGGTTTYSIAIGTLSAITINVENCTYSGTGAIGRHYFLDMQTGAGVFNVYNCTGFESGATASGANAIILSALSGTWNIYNSSFTSTSNGARGVLNVAGATVNAYNSVFSGTGATAFDVRTASGTLTLYSCVLVGNKTDGTITYAGTVVTSDAYVDDDLTVGDDTTIGGKITMGSATANADVFSMIQGAVASDPTFSITQTTNDVAIAQTVGKMDLTAVGEVVVNDAGADVDFRVESDTNANCFGVDAGTDTAYLHGKNSIGEMTELTIDTDGVITVTQGYHLVDTFDDAASDDLVTINGGVTGMILVLRSVNSGRDTTLKDGVANLSLAGDFLLSNVADTITLIYTGSVWQEISRSDNA